MKALLTAKVGMFLVVSSVLAIWTLLAAQHVQAHSLTNPSCSGLPTVEGFFTGTETAPLVFDTSFPASATPKKGTGETGEGKTAHHYAKITVPALTAGELMVSDGTDITSTGPSEGILCGPNVKSLPSYSEDHAKAEKDAAAADKGAMDARDEITKADEDTNDNKADLKDALEDVADDLEDVADDLEDAAAALRKIGTLAANTAADLIAMYNIDDELTDGEAAAAAAAATAADTDAADANATESDLSIDLGIAASALEDAAEDLEIAAIALDPHMGFNINALISSGDEEYVVVVSVPEGDTAPTLNVTFEGVMSTVANAQDGGSFTSPNQRDTHTLATNVPGLLTVKTTGSAVDTIGTLNDGTNDIAMDEGSGGNFEIVSPVKDNSEDDTPADYKIHVDGQTRNEMGEYGLKMEFGVAVNLGTGATYADTPGNRPNDMLEPGRADYFFFNAADHRFLTVETEKPTGVTTETNTTGTLFSQKGLVKTDTDSGAGNNFRLRAPIAPGDYIVEVKGTSSSTKGAYVLKTTSQTAATPDASTNGNTVTGEIASRTAGTLAARDVKPHSINVAKPGTLQVKTTGDLDTVGVLYGPDGQQITEDDNSGPDMNFRITQAVETGQYIVTVEGKAADTVGGYILVVNFVESIVVGTINQVAELEQERDTALAERNTARTALDNLEDEVDNLRDQVAPVTVDATGNLGNPPNDGVRSGIGLISGWVCAANSVQIRISNAQGRVATLNAAYGTTRADTVGSCDHQENTTGFGMTFNFNLLDEGTYTIGAYADGLATQQIGQEATFEVVHLTDEEFPLGLKGECRADDFPGMGDKTILEWEQSIQNFVITDVQ